MTDSSWYGGGQRDRVPQYGWSVHLDSPVETAAYTPSGSSSGSLSWLTSGKSHGKRIIYGDSATYGDHPYICSLQLRQWGIWFHVCGAVIYNENTLLTAAHCVEYYGASRLRVKCGEQNMYMPDDYEQIRPLAAKLPHPDYANDPSQGFPNDLALLRTQTALDLNLNPYVQAFPIDDGKRTYLPVNCSLSGWGRTETGFLPAIVEDVEIDRLTNTECGDRWGANRINDGHVCFQNPYSATSYEGSCSGDSGGPANCGGVIVGVTSWGISQ
ncbi:hypothetical protein ACOMHN_037872 [Nucella lapillus]